MSAPGSVRRTLEWTWTIRVGALIVAAGLVGPVQAWASSEAPPSTGVALRMLQGFVFAALALCLSVLLLRGRRARIVELPRLLQGRGRALLRELTLASIGLGVFVAGWGSAVAAALSHAWSSVLVAISILSLALALLTIRRRSSIDPHARELRIEPLAPLPWPRRTIGFAQIARLLRVELHSALPHERESLCVRIHGGEQLELARVGTGGEPERLFAHVRSLLGFIGPSGPMG